MNAPLKSLPPSIKGLIEESFWTSVQQSARVANYKKGSYLVRAGEVDNVMRIALSGWVSMQRDSTTLGLVTGPLMTATKLVPNQTSTVDLIAVTPVTAVLFDSDTLMKALLASPKGALGLLSLVCNQLDSALSFSARKSSEALDIRLAALLWSLSEPDGSGRRKIPEGLPQSALAGALGASREEVNRKKALLVSAGYIAKEGRTEFMNSLTPLLLSPHEY